MHPFYGKSLKFYLAVWAMVILAHTVFLYKAAGLLLEHSFVDAVISSSLVAAFGFTYWYVVKYLTPSRLGLLNMLFAHAVGVAIGSFITVMLSKSILNASYGGSLEYMLFLHKTITWRIVVAIFYLVIITMIYYLLQYNSIVQEKSREEADIQKLLKQSELEMLKFQLNPHFIFNSLNSISALTMVKPEKAQEMVIKLSEFLRASLNNNSSEIHSLKDELKQMHLYLEIEKTRFGERLEIIENIDHGCVDMKLPNLILQPLYENAIKYGIYEQLEKLVIIINVTCEENNLIVRIKNNFNKESSSLKGKGIGLTNVKNRLDLIYGRHDMMKILDDKDTFEVELVIPQL